MRILFHSPPPWSARSGYCVQAAHAVRALRDIGHEVGLSSYGYHGQDKWDGFPVYGCGISPYGNGLIAYNYRRHQAELLILLCDTWMIERPQLAGLSVMPWLMVDCEPLGIMDRVWLDEVGRIADLRPVTGSEHGRRMIAAAGWDAPVVPMAAGPEYWPDAPAGLEWRREMGIDPRMFVISKVGVNNEDDRKSFGVSLQAFAMLARRRKDAVMYLHCQAQPPKCPNLVMMAMNLGLKGRVAFADEDRRAADMYDDAYMRGMYSGTSLYDGATKGEGFGVPVVEALACGTPVVGCVGSSVPEKITPEHGWLVGGQKFWPRHHQAWWREPDVGELFRVYERAANTARSMRPAAAAAGEQWRPELMAKRWTAVLDSGAC